MQASRTAVLGRGAQLRNAARPAKLAVRQPAQQRAVAVRFQDDKQSESAVGQKTIIEMINKDHSLFFDLYKQYQSNDDNDQKIRLAYTMIREVAMHSSAEEEVMYPEVRKRLGDESADMLLKEHKELKKVLYSLSQGSKRNSENPSEFDGKLEKAVSLLKEHIKEEEEDFWPKFEKLPEVDKETLLKLGKSFAHAKDHAVTRPHTWAPDKPPMNVVGNAATAPLDALLDTWRFAFDIPHPQGEGRSDSK